MLQNLQTKQLCNKYNHKTNLKGKKKKIRYRIFYLTPFKISKQNISISGHLLLPGTYTSHVHCEEEARMATSIQI